MKWNKLQIQNARKTHLVPLLANRRYRLRKLENQNYLIEDYGKLIVKQSYWVWYDKKQSGNAIDFFINVEGKSFSQAMEILGSKQIIPENITKQPDKRSFSKISDILGKALNHNQNPLT